MPVRSPSTTIRKRKSPGRPQTVDATPATAPYLKNLDKAVRKYFAEAEDLPTFLARPDRLDGSQQIKIVQQALVLISGNYVHLPLKRAMHAVDPVQRLRLFKRRLEQTPEANKLPDVEFHRELTEIFNALRDRHTVYVRPKPFNGMTAFLPFLIEDCYENKKRKYLVSHLMQGFDESPHFVPGVEVVYWNGVPIERAVLNAANRCTGSNAEARLARAIQTLTLRALSVSAPPDEEWVVVGFRKSRGILREIRVHWVVIPTPPKPVRRPKKADRHEHAMGLGFDLEQGIVHRTLRALFAPQVITAQKRAAKKVKQGQAFDDLESNMPQIFEARKVNAGHGRIGYVRIRSFHTADRGGFVSEFIRLLSCLPQNGLIIDVRGNGGGWVINAEMILQLLTPNRIEPQPFQFLNTPLNLEICRRNERPIQCDLSPWVESMERSLLTGEVFSSGFPMSDPLECNRIGQRYFGPVVVVTDALCYSATDVFVAGIKDHEIGRVLGVDGNTGAGGANVWNQIMLKDYFSSGKSRYTALPESANIKVAMRRAVRVGPRSGVPVEDLGVIPDEPHSMTRKDLLQDNVDLIKKAASILSKGPFRGLTVTTESTSDSHAAFVAATQGISRLDVYLDDRPVDTVDVEKGQAWFQVAKLPGGGNTLEIRGFDGPLLVARYRTIV
ncbi:S41 family peptidase [Thermodesulfobacteriota bacterium]